MTHDLLKIAEVAEYLRVSDDTVRRLISGTEKKPPELDSIRIRGAVRIPRAGLEVYVKSSTKRAGTTKVSEKNRIRFGL